MEILFCDIVVQSSGFHYPAATNWCAPVSDPDDAQRYFTITCLSVTSVLSCTFRAISQGTNYAKLLTLEACADSSLTRIVGNTSHYYRAYLCEIENAAKSTCSCVNSDLQCLSFDNVDSGVCANMIESLPSQVYTTYFVSILCGVLCLLMTVLSLMSWRFNNIIKYEDDDEKQDYHIQIVLINFISALSFTSGAYFFFSSGAFESILHSIHQFFFLKLKPEVLNEVQNDMLSSLDSMAHSNHPANAAISNSSLFSFVFILIGFVAGSFAIYTVAKSFLNKKAAPTVDEDALLQNPGTSTVEIIRHLNVGKFDHMSKAGGQKANAKPVQRVSSDEYYGEINRVNTVDLLDDIQNPLRKGKTQNFVSPSGGKKKSVSEAAGSEVDTVTAIRRMANNTNFISVGNGNQSSVQGVPKSNTIDLMEELAANKAPSNQTPYSPNANNKENSYYNLNTVDFIRNGENATVKNSNNGPAGVRKPASGGNAKDANAGGWFANISLQNPFEKN
eukprot:gene25664-34237_t